jgi:hypothetical protein
MVAIPDGNVSVSGTVKVFYQNDALLRELRKTLIVAIRAHPAWILALHLARLEASSDELERADALGFSGLPIFADPTMDPGSYELMTADRLAEWKKEQSGV